MDGDSSYEDEEEWGSRVNFGGGNQSHPTQTHNCICGNVSRLCDYIWKTKMFWFFLSKRGVSVSHVCYGISKYHSL